MPPPILYATYTSGEAVALFGARGHSRSLCGGQWVLLPSAILCFATIGPAPERPHFQSADSFVWVADRAYRASSEWPAALPLEVRQGQGHGRPIHLFARASGESGYIYLGGAAPANPYGYDAGRITGTFRLIVPLPSDVWRRLGTYLEGVGSADALDESLVALERVPTLKERLAIVERVVAYWRGPRRTEDGLPAQELKARRLPDPLRHWYELYGRRADLLRCPGHILAPDELEADDEGQLVFYVEEQGVYLWATRPEGEDPPVWI
jgi:hypothetical protein